MILCDIKNGRTTISGPAVIICGELEEIIRKVNKSFIDMLGKEGAEEIMHELFNNALLSEEERDKKANRNVKEADSELIRDFEKFLSGLFTE